MRRRDLLKLAGLVAARPLLARAGQPNKTPRIGFLLVNSAEAEAKIGVGAAFHRALRSLGYMEGQNIVVEDRFGDGDPDQLRRKVVELLDLNLDVLVSGGEGVYALARATKTVPIVAATAGDVVALGMAQSFARPGGNLTGSVIFGPEIHAKRLELLVEALPSLKCAGVLGLRDMPVNRLYSEAIASVAKTLKVELRTFEVADAADYEAAFSSSGGPPIDGFVIADPARFLGDAKLIATIAKQHRMPTVGAPLFAANGLLLGYGADVQGLFAHAADFVDKILKGANPGDLPIERASRFRTIINLATASALGLQISPTLLARADEVIE